MLTIIQLAQHSLFTPITVPLQNNRTIYLFQNSVSYYVCMHVSLRPLMWQTLSAIHLRGHSHFRAFPTPGSCRSVYLVIRKTALALSRIRRGLA